VAKLVQQQGRFVGSPRVAVIHATRVKGFASTEALCEMTGLDAATVLAETARASAEGLMVHRDGRITGWMLTPAGREAHPAEVAAETSRSAARELIEATYERFVALNHPFKVLCTEWQTTNQSSACVGKLVRLDSSVQRILAPISAAVARFSPYPRRFGTARDRLQAGDRDYFTRPLSGSYHDVWMELHQDFMLTLGRERAAADGH
jgi:hypothetical protein